jgi:hypothetical protein
VSRLRVRLCIFYEVSEQTAGETMGVGGRIKLKYIVKKEHRAEFIACLPAFLFCELWSYVLLCL